MKTFEGKKALVIGGSGGIGAEISLLLAQNGAALTIHGGHQSDKFSDLLAKCNEAASVPATALVQEFSADTFSTLADSPIAASAATADVLCVCYGPFVQKMIDETTFEDWQTLSLFNYALPGFLVSTALHGMIKKQWGRILLFGGTGTSHRSEFTTNAAYAGAKAGISTLVQSTAANYADFGITCNAVLPGFTKTEYNKKSILSLAKKMPLGTMLETKSVAESAMFLLQNPDLNGVLLRVDRGWTPNFLKKDRD